MISPQSARYDRITKARLYATHHIPFYWLIDPIAKSLEGLELNEGRWVIAQTFKEDDLVCARPFDQVSFDLSDLWVD